MDALEPSSGADRNSNYRPEPGTLLFLLLLLRYQLIQTITLYAPEEAGCGFENERRLYCRDLDMFHMVSECCRMKETDCSKKTVKTLFLRMGPQPCTTLAEHLRCARRRERKDAFTLRLLLSSAWASF